MTDYPLLCLRGYGCRPQDKGGPRRTNGGWICDPCADYLRRDLVQIADAWDDLEDALSRTEQAEGEKGNQKHGMVATGTNLNEKAMAARTQATEVVWFILGVLRDDMDDLGRRFNPPHTHTGELARWIGRWHVDHLARHTADETAVEITTDVTAAWRAVRSAAYPSGVHWVEVGLPCEQHGTSDMGERVRCEGTMQALVGRGSLPDLVCSVEPTHFIEPSQWERAGWRKAHTRMHPDGMTRLANRMSS